MYGNPCAIRLTKAPIDRLIGPDHDGDLGIQLNIRGRPLAKLSGQFRKRVARRPRAPGDKCPFDSSDAAFKKNDDGQRDPRPSSETGAVRRRGI
jgi:hypothetical protein